MWPNFWQKMAFSRCSNCDILDFVARRKLPFTTTAFFLNTQHARNCFFLGREKNGHDTISWLHVFAAMHDSTTMRPFHEIIHCTTYCLGADPTENIASSSPSTVFIVVFLAIARISFPRERVYRAFA
jgi:hypothetical protein